MWTSICNFLCDKFFYRSELNSPLSNNDSEECIYGKRIKLSPPECHTSGSINQTKSRIVPMQAKENQNKNDDEDECCVIAEIPRRKRPENALNENKASHLSILKSTRSNEDLSPSFQREALKNNDRKEIEVVKTISNSSLRGLSKVHTKNKFFTTQRASFNHGKIMRDRASFKNQLRRRLNFLQESYRLTEKFQYMQLLQSHTSCDLLAITPAFRNLKCLKQAIPIIDLTEEKATENCKEIEPYAPETSKKSSEDQDVQIVREIPPGVRSFQDILKIKPVNTNETIQEILSKHSKNNSGLLEITEIDDNSVSLLDQSISKKTCPDTLEEKLQNFMQITGSKPQEIDVEDHYCLPDLTEEQEKKIRSALLPYPSNEILARAFGLQITRRDMQTLMGLNWLNDEVINFYMNLIVERSKQNKNLPKVYSFNTFFYPKLSTSDYMSLRRWTKQVDIFSYDILLIPIHLGMHWCMSLIDFRCKSVQYYDSIGGSNDACLDRLLYYLKAESLDKKNKIFSTKDWKKSNVRDIPQQMNGSDCGVFSCMFAEHLARDCAILFTQDDMPYFRKKMVIEILEGKLLT